MDSSTIAGFLGRHTVSGVCLVLLVAVAAVAAVSVTVVEALGPHRWRPWTGHCRRQFALWSEPFVDVDSVAVFVGTVT